MIEAHAPLAVAVRDRLRELNCRIVLAESCTAGQIAAALAVVPGISNWLCGSFVVYRSASKQAWLRIPDEVLTNPDHGPVSPLASRLLARAALEYTPEADWALAITGDVGPGAPPRTDGVCFVAIVRRSENHQLERSIRLVGPAPLDASDIAGRIRRLSEATSQALHTLLEALKK